MMSITIVVASYAHQNPFERNRTQKMNKAKIMAMNPMPKMSAANINVPTISKSSWWNDFNNVWDPSSALRSTYLNDKLVSELQVSYTLTDTFGKYIYTYDNNNRYSMIEYKNYNPGTHTFTDNGRMTYTYASYGSYVALGEVYDMGTNTWTPNMREIRLYDNHFNNIRSSYESYQNGMWQINFGYASKITYYNNTNKISESIDSNYNQTTMQMEASYKANRTYNSAGLVQSILSYSYNNNVAELDEVDSVKYDNLGIPITLIIYDVTTMDPMFKIHDISWAGGFNPNVDLFENQPSSYLESGYMNNTWILTGRFTLQHPDNYGSVIFLDEEYDNNVYFPSYRRSQLNDSHLNGIEESEEEYDTFANVWITRYGYKNSYLYDMSGNITENISMQYQTMDTAYVNNQKMEFSNFINIAAGVNSTKTIETKLFPNPSVNGSVSINLNLEKSSAINIELFDVNGRIIYSQNEDFGQGLNTIQLDGLTQGLYFVVISSDYGVSRTKMIVK